jgi:hypothetical protein
MRRRIVRTMAFIRPTKVGGVDHPKGEGGGA